jgi:hypothetical protein
MAATTIRVTVEWRKGPSKKGEKGEAERKTDGA